MQPITFTNTDNFTINDNELQEANIKAIEAAMKREALKITAHNLKVACRASIAATVRFLDQATR